VNLNKVLPTILKKENIAKIEDGFLLIGDRRKYPFSMSFVECKTIEEVCDAIKGMVTQGGGPLQVALTAMCFVALQIYNKEKKDSIETFRESGNLLMKSRPTNTTMTRTLNQVIDQIKSWYICEQIRRTNNNDLIYFVESLVLSYEEKFNNDYLAMGKLGSALIKEGDGILTTCFAEHSFILSLIEAQKEGKKFTVYVSETRPYMQGSRLTAPSLDELGLNVVVITDGMGANLIQHGLINRYMTAADLVTMDGSVVNKVGSLANAIACSYYNIPYTVFAMSPDPSKTDKKEIEFEFRDAKEVVKGETLEHIKGLYPAFDYIESSLVDTIVTPKGIFSPNEIEKIFTLGS